ncbi:MAG: hypothetical protein ABSF63_01610 [Candidatus Bathyarchaeia archaeon]
MSHADERDRRVNVFGHNSVSNALNVIEGIGDNRPRLPVPSEYKMMIVDKMWRPHWNRLSEAQQKLVDDKIMHIIRFKPYESEGLGGELAGLRSYNKLESDLRIYFAICYECRKGGFVKVNNCPDCQEIENDVVKLFAAGPHSLLDTLGRERRKRIDKRKK